MRRLFWVAVGATTGVVVARRVSRARRALTPDVAGERVAQAVGGVAAAVREFSADVRHGMATREVELRQLLGVVEEVPVPERVDGAGPYPARHAAATPVPSRSRGRR